MEVRDILSETNTQTSNNTYKTTPLLSPLFGFFLHPLGSLKFSAQDNNEEEK